MKISICMMVKDEEKNIRRCLNSLKPILKNIDSELVIVDTGSKDKTVEISSEYTDKIYFHEWENDFSGMRNKTISYAKGNWIFIIDADEEIIDCNNIIQFLKSSTNNKFQTGLLNVKNIQNLSDDSQYAMLKSPRLFRNDGEFHYEGIVHNNPIFKQPSIDLETTIVHYGYIEENEDILNKKFIRTSKLLKSALDKDPKNIYYLFQLSVTYTSHNDYFKGYEIIKSAYELLKECKDKSKYKYIYYQMALCSLKLEEDEIAKRVCEEGVELDGEYIDLIFYLGKAKGLLGEYEGCIKAYQKYIDLCDNYNNMNINFDVSLGMYTLGQKDEALQDMVKIYFKLGKFDEVLKFASQIEKDRYIQNVLELIISSAISCKNINYLKNFYEEKILSDNVRENIFFLILEKYCDNDIYKLFSSYNNDYSKLYLLRYKYDMGDSNFEQFIENISFEADFNILENYFGDVLYFKLKYSSSLFKLFENVWDKNINRYLEYISKKYEDFSDAVVKYINNIKDDMNYENFRINKILCRYILLIDKIDDFEYEWIFKYYLDIGIKLITNIYNEEYVEEEYINDLKNEEEKFFVYINIAMKNSEDDRTYIKYLRKSLEAYHYMKKGIELLLKEFKEKIKYDDNNKFENYKFKVKENINNLINQGNLEEARKVIDEYEEIIKKDLDIYSMKAVIYIINNKFKDAMMILKEGLAIDENNFDLNYNLAYIYEQTELYLESLETYEKIVFNMKESNQRTNIIEKINNLEEKNKEIIRKQLKERNYTVDERLFDGKKVNLHLMYDSQYCDKFIHFVSENFSADEHKFIIIHNRNEKLKLMNISEIENVEIIDLRYELDKLLYYIEDCSRIFTHYLMDYFCEIVCRFNIEKPIYWICWGGDFYNYIDLQMYDNMTGEILHGLGIDINKKINKNNIYYIYRKTTLRKISKILTNSEIDFNEIKEKFVTNAKFTIFNYPNPVDFADIEKSNKKIISKKYNFKKKFKYLILLGNSANPSNNHIEVLNELKKINSKDFGVIVPLSYGRINSYVDVIIKKGKELLGDKFIPITEYIQSEDYFEILKQVDVAIFNHNRQQARGNIRILLHLGKKVYVKSTITTYAYFNSIGVKLYDASEIKNRKLDEIVNMRYEDKKNNKIAIDLNSSNAECLEYAKDIFNN